MRIAYVCSDVDVPLYGSEGCSIHVRSLTRAFAAAGHDVTVLCASVGEGEPMSPRIRVRKIDPSPLAWEEVEQQPVVQDHHLERDLRSLAWNHWLLEAAGDEPPDVVYERYALFGFGGLALARRHGVPHLLELNAPLCEEQAGYERFTLTRAADRIEQQVVTGTDAVLAVSPWLADWAVRRGADADSVHVVPNGVDEDVFTRLPDRNAARTRIGLRAERVVGYVGSFQPWHHLDGLLRAFADLARRDDGLRLLLVGDGPGRQSAAERAGALGIGDAVVFTGHVGHRDAAALLAAMDVAVVPYAAVGSFYFSPLKLFESMAAGTPTVAAAIGQIAEVVEHGRTGWLYPPGDDAALAAGLERLLTHPAQAAALGRAAREHILSEHTWTAVAQRVVRLAELQSTAGALA